MPFRSGLIAAVICAGCATAGHPNQPPPQRTDGGGMTNDAPPGPRPDAPPQDAFVQPPDGPSGPCSFSGVLATWDMSGLTGTNTSAPATSTATGVTAGVLTHSSGVMSSSYSGALSANNWPSSSQLDATKYFTLTVSPPAGCSLSLTSMAITASKSSTGPANGAAASSADSFAQTSPVSTSSTSNPTLSVSGATSAVEVRIYGFGAGSAAGTFRVSSVAVSGSLN